MTQLVKSVIEIPLMRVMLASMWALFQLIQLWARCFVSVMLFPMWQSDQVEKWLQKQPGYLWHVYVDIPDDQEHLDIQSHTQFCKMYLVRRKKLPLD